MAKQGAARSHFWSILVAAVVAALYLVSVSQPAQTAFSPRLTYRTKAGVTLECAVRYGASRLPELLELSAALQAPVAYFVTLEFAERCPELFGQLCESGAQVGLLAAGEPDFAQEIARAQEVFLARGLTLTHVMPADDKKAGPLSAAAHEAGLATMVCTFELRARSTDPAGLVAKVKSSLFDGAVVRFEPTLLTVEAFPQIVEAIRERGLVFNTLTSANSQ